MNVLGAYFYSKNKSILLTNIFKYLKSNINKQSIN